MKLMNKKHLTYILVFLLSLSPVHGQFLEVDRDKYIEWSDTLYLRWSDYVLRSVANKNQSSALTSVFHSVRGGMKNGQPNFQVKVLFVKEDSWTTDDQSLPLLAHEKLHFDLAELYGRKIRRQIALLGKDGTTDLAVYKRYIKYLLNEFKKVSTDYDKETRYGNLASQQEKWLNYVSNELKRLHEYM